MPEMLTRQLFHSCIINFMYIYTLYYIYFNSVTNNYIAIIYNHASYLLLPKSSWLAIIYKLRSNVLSFYCVYY